MMVDNWSQYIHPRALEFFPDIDAIRKVLSEVLNFLDRSSDDPVLGSEDKCVHWYGKIAKYNEESQSVVTIKKPGDTTDTVTYVNRVLPFIFADDESFEELMLLPKEPFTMACGNQLCINLCHISFGRRDTPDEQECPPATTPPQGSSTSSNPTPSQASAGDKDKKATTGPGADSAGAGGNKAAEPKAATSTTADNKTAGSKPAATEKSGAPAAQASGDSKSTTASTSESQSVDAKVAAK